MSLDENPNVWINFAHEESSLNALPDVLTHPAYDAWLDAQRVVMIDAAAVFLDGPHVEEMTGNQKTVKAFAHEDEAEEGFGEVNQRLSDVSVSAISGADNVCRGRW